MAVPSMPDRVRSVAGVLRRQEGPHEFVRLHRIDRCASYKLAFKSASVTISIMGSTWERSKPMCS
jgi:hypothetical protein